MLQNSPKEEMIGHPGGSGKASMRKSSLSWICEGPAIEASLEGFIGRTQLRGQGKRRGAFEHVTLSVVLNHHCIGRTITTFLEKGRQGLQTNDPIFSTCPGSRKYLSVLGVLCPWKDFSDPLS